MCTLVGVSGIFDVGVRQNNDIPAHRLRGPPIGEVMMVPCILDSRLWKK